MTQPHAQESTIPVTPLGRALRQLAQKKRLSSLDVPVLEDAADELDALDQQFHLLKPNGTYNWKQRAEQAEAALLTLQTAVKALAQRMQTCSRYKSHDLGYEDSVSSSRVDDWADELIALLPDTAGTTPQP